MARVENVFALLGDGDGDDDVSALLERVAAVRAEPPPLEKKKKDKQQQHQKQPVEKEESDWGLDDAVSMKAKPIVLPDYGDCLQSIFFCSFYSIVRLLLSCLSLVLIGVLIILLRFLFGC